MNEQTDKLIRELAAKLNTTAEHLWEVLINQAHYEVISSCLQVGIWILLTVAWLAFVRRRTSSQHPEQWQEEGAAFAWIGAFIMIVICGFAISSAINTRFNCINPEYWAASQLRAFIK